MVRRDVAAARAIAWFWAMLEIVNGIGHTLFALNAGGYFPGVATAPLLIATGAYLVRELTAES